MALNTHGDEAKIQHQTEHRGIVREHHHFDILEAEIPSEAHGMLNQPASNTTTFTAWKHTQSIDLEPIQRACFNNHDRKNIAPLIKGTKIPATLLFVIFEPPLNQLNLERNQG